MTMLLTSIVILFGCHPRSDGKKPLLIAAASSMRYVVNDVAHQFSQRTGIPTETVFGSSGKLTAQILNAAPYDVLLTADAKYLEPLQASQKIQRSMSVGHGTLILWSMSPLNSMPSALTDLRRLAIANPELAPYGTAALQFLKHSNLDKSTLESLVYGENVGQVNQFITSGAVDAGFTALTAVRGGPFADKGHWHVVPDSTYSPIEHTVALLTDHDQALEFAQFLNSTDGKRILSKYGFRK